MECVVQNLNAAITLFQKAIQFGNRNHTFAPSSSTAFVCAVVAPGAAAPHTAHESGSSSVICQPVCSLCCKQLTASWVVSSTFQGPFVVVGRIKDDPKGAPRKSSRANPTKSPKLLWLLSYFWLRSVTFQKTDDNVGAPRGAI